jgi:hypothetical protein
MLIAAQNANACPIFSWQNIEEAFFNVVLDQKKHLKTGKVKKSLCGFIPRTFLQ